MPRTSTRRPPLTRALAAAFLASVLPHLAAPALGQCDSPFLGPDTTGSTLVPSINGAIIPGTESRDDFTTALPAPPFALRLFGQTYTVGAVSTNGVLGLGPGGLNASFFNSTLPSNVFGPAIFAYWDDLVTTNASGGIYTNTTGVAPERVFEVRWQVRHISGTAPFAFSIYFFESPASPEFLIAYAPGNEPLAQASSATIGLQAGSSGPAATFSFNQQVITSTTRLTPRCLAQSISFQGRLTDASGPISGTADLTFTYLNATAATVGVTIPRPATPVANGLFTVTLPSPDLNALAAGGVRVRVTANGSTLTPDQPVTFAPAANFAIRAQSADAAGSVPWSGITGAPSNLSPWIINPNSVISYTAGNVGINTTTPEQRLTVNGSMQLLTGTSAAPTSLAFGTVGDGIGGADNTDLMAFRRVNIAANRSELRLIIGDDPTADPAAADFFSIGAAPGGTWTPVIGFRSDGLASKPGGGTWAAISDPRTKHDIAPLSGALDLLLSLRGYSFFYNDNEVTKGRALPGRQIGLMADEVERVFPDWVSRDGDGIRMVTERGTTALTVEALRELRDEKDRQIDALQADLARRDADLAAQQRQINDLLTRLERLESAGKP
jgi:hypothetical protein